MTLRHGAHGHGEFSTGLTWSQVYAFQYALRCVLGHGNAEKTLVTGVLKQTQREQLREHLAEEAEVELGAFEEREEAADESEDLLLDALGARRRLEPEVGQEELEELELAVGGAHPAQLLVG